MPPVRLLQIAAAFITHFPDVQTHRLSDFVALSYLQSRRRCFSLRPIRPLCIPSPNFLPRRADNALPLSPRKLSARTNSLSAAHVRDISSAHKYDVGLHTRDPRAVVRGVRKNLVSRSDENVDTPGLTLPGFNNSECLRAACELIAAHPQAAVHLNDGRGKALATELDNRACVDNFCTSPVGSAWRKGAHSRRHDREPGWFTRSVETPRRTGSHGPSQPGCARRPWRQPPHTSHLFAVKIRSKRHRTKSSQPGAGRLIKWDRPAIEQSIRLHDCQLSALVKCEVRRKLDTGTKN